MGENYTPADLERMIDDTLNRIAKGIQVVADARALAQEAGERLAQARASAYLKAEGTAGEREAATTLQTAQERRHAQLTDAAYKYAQDKLGSLEKQLIAFQSLYKGARESYGAVRTDA